MKLFPLSVDFWSTEKPKLSCYLNVFRYIKPIDQNDVNTPILRHRHHVCRAEVAHDDVVADHLGFGLKQAVGDFG